MNESGPKGNRTSQRGMKGKGCVREQMMREEAWGPKTKEKRMLKEVK
jgi:hypothetical protein